MVLQVAIYNENRGVHHSLKGLDISLRMSEVCEYAMLVCNV